MMSDMFEEWIEEDEEQLGRQGWMGIADKFPMTVSLRLQRPTDLLVLASIANMGAATLYQCREQIEYALPSRFEELQKALEKFFDERSEVSYSVYSDLTNVLSDVLRGVEL